LKQCNIKSNHLPIRGLKKDSFMQFKEQTLKNVERGTLIIVQEAKRFALTQLYIGDFTQGIIYTFNLITEQ
jgi:hypothetical protein